MKNKNNYKLLIILTLIVLGLWLISWWIIVTRVTLWSERGDFGDMFGGINSLFSGLALIGIVYSIYIQISYSISDHERRRKQATIEYINSISPAYQDLKNIIIKDFGDEILTKERVDLIFKNEEKKSIIRGYLNALEHLSVGANTAVFDKDILFRTSGTRIVKTYRNFQLYFKKIQKENPSVYSEFCHLAKEFERRKSIPILEEGKIK